MRHAVISLMLGCLAALTSAYVLADDAPPPAKKESFWQLIHDPDDHAIDMSRWLLQHKGALIVPIIITEPAVGNGGGASAVFFQPAKQSQASKDSGEHIPPNIYGFGAAKTQNGTYGAVAAGEFHFRDDQWRYKGAVGKASANLDFYTKGLFLGPRKIGYNLDGWFSFQQVSRRLGSLPLYIGARWIYIDLDSSLNVEGNRQFFKPRDFASRASGLGPVIEWDTRDNTLTPSRGLLATAESTFYAPGLGSDNTFQSYRAHVLGYVPMGPRFVLGLRADYRTAPGSTPFYQLPSIDLRGISYGRYQDRSVGVLEAELRWNMTHRWAALAFGGAGRAWGRRTSFDDASTETTKGVGFRYLIASALGLYAGVDWAWARDDHAWYLQVGSAWR
jgi:outer membrane protein assembly factor BamA